MRLNFRDKHAFWADHDPPYPMIAVSLVGQHNKIAHTYALVDSGADHCMFHAQWAKQIGLKLSAGRRDYLYGIDADSKHPVYFHRVDLIICGMPIRCEVAFSRHMGTDWSDQLIGRSIIFDKIRFAFQQKHLVHYTGPEN